MPDGVSALERLGVSMPAMQAYPFRGIRFLSSGLSVEASFPHGLGFGVRRTNLHRVMVDHAERVGVRFRWRAVVTGLHPDGVLMHGSLIPTRWIVGADGSSSRVRRWSGLDAHRRKEERFAFRRHYRVAPWAEFMELHWGNRCQLYVTPVGPEEVCIALISRDHRLRLDEALSEFPEIAERLRGAEHGSVERGAISVTRKLTRVRRGQVALVGDASGGVDAITGAGLCLSFKQADLLAECLVSGDLASYQAGHRALARRPVMMARLMVLLEHREKLRRRVMGAFIAEPKVFARMLATHVGAVRPVVLAANGLALGWKLLTAQNR